MHFAEEAKCNGKPRPFRTKAGHALFACLYHPIGTTFELIEYLPAGPGG